MPEKNNIYQKPVIEGYSLKLKYSTFFVGNIFLTMFKTPSFNLVFDCLKIVSIFHFLINTLFIRDGALALSR
jgi:hypothetical protein